MSQFSKFLLKRIEENNLTKKRSIRELSREIGISHDYLGRIIHGKVIAPEGEIQEKIAYKILKKNEYQEFYDLAAKNRGEIPIDIAKALSQKTNKWDEIRKILEVKKWVKK